MIFFLSMLPIYLTGNLHCLGMCGPLVMTLANHPFRVLYFFGRALSFGLLGLISATFGMALEIGLKTSGVQAIVCFALGLMIMFFAFSGNVPLPKTLGRRLGKASQFLSTFLLKNRPMSTFYFGFFTPLLPCGQTLMVFSAIALHGNPLAGLLNGLAFALLTSPSLFFAMKAASFFHPKAFFLRFLMPLVALPPACFAFLRGFAEMGYIEHASITLPFGLHLVLY